MALLLIRTKEKIITFFWGGRSENVFSECKICLGVFSVYTVFVIVTAKNKKIRILHFRVKYFHELCFDNMNGKEDF